MLIVVFLIIVMLILFLLMIKFSLKYERFSHEMSSFLSEKYYLGHNIYRRGRVFLELDLKFYGNEMRITFEAPECPDWMLNKLKEKTVREIFLRQHIHFMCWDEVPCHVFSFEDISGKCTFYFKNLVVNGIKMSQTEFLARFKAGEFKTVDGRTIGYTI